MSDRAAGSRTAVRRGARCPRAGRAACGGGARLGTRPTRPPPANEDHTAAGRLRAVPGRVRAGRVPLGPLASVASGGQQPWLVVYSSRGACPSQRTGGEGLPDDAEAARQRPTRSPAVTTVPRHTHAEAATLRNGEDSPSVSNGAGARLRWSRTNSSLSGIDAAKGYCQVGKGCGTLRNCKSISKHLGTSWLDGVIPVFAVEVRGK